MYERPKTLDEIVGQKEVIERIRISVVACLAQNQIMPHILLYGAPGFGKTTLASAIANELDKPILITNGRNLKSLKDLLIYLPKIKGGIFFLDEVHSLNKNVSELLYSTIEDFVCTLSNSKLKLEIEPFTFIGATTSPGGILKPLRDRCTFQYELVEYTVDELAQIASDNATKVGFDLDDECCKLIAKCSRGTPRICLNRLRWIHDFSVSHQTPISPTIIKRALKLAKISPDGIEDIDRRYLMALKGYETVSLATLSSKLNMDVTSIREIIEPFLIQKNLIKITTKGRCLNI